MKSCENELHNSAWQSSHRQLWWCCTIPLVVLAVLCAWPLFPSEGGTVSDAENALDVVTFVQRSYTTEFQRARKRVHGIQLSDYSFFQKGAISEVEHPVEADLKLDTVTSDEDSPRFPRLPRVFSDEDFEAVPRHGWHRSTRYKRRHWDDHHAQFDRFWKSAVFEEWMAFIGGIIVFLVVQYYIFEWPTRFQQVRAWTAGGMGNYHGWALLIWFSLAAIVNLIIMFVKGGSVASEWFSGYMLELVFSLENVFIFHVVARAFRMPRRQTSKALAIVVVMQIMWEFLFFMGLAWQISASRILPYILGVWLLYLGFLAGSEGEHSEINWEDTWVYSWSTWMLGDRLVNKYSKGDTRLILWGDEKVPCKVTLLFIATVSLVLVDFLLEVDVVLTKIEELDNHFMAFSSSAAAAFAMPELFFVSRDLFARFYLMKFGITFVLVFFGIGLLASDFVEVPIMFQIIVIIVVMAACMVLSSMLSVKKSDLDADKEEDWDRHETVSSDGE